MDWEPIETAPKDRTKILLYCPDAINKYSVGYWDSTPVMRCWFAGGLMKRSNLPEYWMPLPKPPEV